MKLLISLCLLIFLFSSCAQDKVIDGNKYSTYGLFNEKDLKNDSISYEVSGWAVVGGIVFIETIIWPVYVVGWDLWEPVGKVSPTKGYDPDKGIK